MGCPALDPQVRRHRGGTLDRAGAAAQQAGHSGSEITRRHYVERSVTVPDYTAALDEYSRPIRAFRPLKSNRPGDIPT